MINTLAENARKYTPKGGTIKIYARKENDYVEISVEDNGRGLSPEDVAHIIGEKIYDSKAIVPVPLLSEPDNLFPRHLHTHSEVLLIYFPKN